MLDCGNGELFDPLDPNDSWDENIADGYWTAVEIELATRRLNDGRFLSPDGSVMPEANARRLRHRILGTYGFHALSRDRVQVPPGRWLIPGLWRWGHIPMLAGNPKAGKTSLLIEMTAALLIPGYRFLGTFEPAELTDDERERGVWLFNAETPAGDFNEGLEAVGLSLDDERLHVVHLEFEGGEASALDLTDPEHYARWEFDLIQCWECQGEDDQAPIAVLVDGLTAILSNDMTRYGTWYHEFRSLMRSLDVPNAIASGHATQAGGHLMGGVEAQAQADGLWTYSSMSADDTTSKRYFSVRPRLGGAAVPRTQIVMEDGRLLAKHRAGLLTPGSVRAAVPVEAVHASANRAGGASKEARAGVLAKLGHAGARGMRSTEITGSGEFGKDRRKALRELEAEKVIASRPEGRGERWWLSNITLDAVPGVATDADSVIIDLSSLREDE
jgi:hypothetical protein